MSQKKEARIEAISIELAEAHRQAALAAEAGMDNEAYEWRQEASMLAKELVEARIDRPFTAYEDEYGDYPI